MRSTKEKKNTTSSLFHWGSDKDDENDTYGGDYTVGSSMVAMIALSSTTTSQLEYTWLLQTSIAEAIGGATAGVVADTVLYAVDSAKVRRQTAPVAIEQLSSSSSSIRDQASAVNSSWMRRWNNAIVNIKHPKTFFRQNRILFRGLVPTVTLGSVPIFGSFFLLYAPIRETIHFRSKTDPNNTSETIMLPLAAAICAVPSTVLGVPADVLKKHLVLGKDPSFTIAVRNILKEQGARGLFAGWHVNLIRDIPFACVKVGLYELFVSYYKTYNGLTSTEKLSTTGAAICGVSSGIGCAILTAPLDVINTRIKAGDTVFPPPPPRPRASPSTSSTTVTATTTTTSTSKMMNTSAHQHSTSIVYVGRNIVAHEGISALFRGVLMRSFVLGVGSSLFWPIQNRISHYLQPDYDPNFHDRLEEF